MSSRNLLSVIVYLDAKLEGMEKMGKPEKSESGGMSPVRVQLQRFREIRRHPHLHEEVIRWLEDDAIEQIRIIMNATVGEIAELKTVLREHGLYTGINVEITSGGARPPDRN